MRVQPPSDKSSIFTYVNTNNPMREKGRSHWITVKGRKVIDGTSFFFPFYGTGQRLWVKELFKFNRGGPIYDAAGGLMDSMDDELLYHADGPHRESKWTSARLMPRWASRITIEITGVRVERLQDISEDDCLAEGIAQVIYDSLPRLQQCGEYDGIDVDLVGKYGTFWDSIHGPGAWERNPWVWVIEFEQVKL